MPGAAPTEILAEDIGELRESNRQVATEVKTLAASVNSLQAESAGFKAAVSKDLWWVRAIGAGLIAILLWAVKEGYNLSYQAGTLSSEVRLNALQIEKRFDQLEKRMDKHEAKIDQQLGLIIQRLDQFVPKSKP
jgi:hypothetical protein